MTSQRAPAKKGLPGAETVPQLKRLFLRELQNKELPWLQAGGIDRLLLGLPPITKSAGFKIADVHTQSGVCGDTDLVHPAVAERSFKPLRYPGFAFVLEGEADVRLGVPPATRHPAGQDELYCQVASLSAGQGVLIPSGVARDLSHHHALCNHWYRASPERASSRILWLAVLPDGVLVHICRTHRQTHLWSPELFVKEPLALVLTDRLIELLMSRPPGYSATGGSHLEAILTRTGEALAHNRLFLHSLDSDLAESTGESAWNAASSGDNAFLKAKTFIESHLHEALSPALIADSVPISATHLNRIFRREAGMSVMRYVTRHRLSVAQTLLAETKLPINEIAEIVGIPNPDGFAIMFTRAVGQAPSAYRKRHPAAGDGPPGVLPAKNGAQ